MKKLAIFLGIIFSLFAACLLYVALFLNLNDYKPLIVHSIEENTGLKVGILGDIEVDILPDIALKIEKVSLGDAGDELVKIEELVAVLKLRPLFNKQIEFASFNIYSPNVRLVVDKNGQGNWQKFFDNVGVKDKDNTDAVNSKVAARHSKDKVISDKGRAETAVEIADAPTLSELLRFESIVISKGKISYIDKFRQRRLEIQDVEVNSTLAFGVINRLKLAAHMSGIEGKAGDLSLLADFLIEKNKVNFTDIIFSLGDIKLKGEFLFNFADALPLVKSGIYITDADFNPYQDFLKQSFFVETNAIKEKVASASKKNTGTKELEGKTSAANVNVAAIKERFSSDRIDILFLREFNFHLGLQVKGFKYQGIEFDRLVFHGHSQGGKVIGKVKELSMLSGKVIADFLINVEDDIPIITGKVDVDNIDLSLLPAHYKVLSSIKGGVVCNINFITQGGSIKDYVNNLNGKASLLIENGSLKGFDLLSVAGNILSVVEGKGVSKDTHFAKMQGNFIVTNGVIKNDDLLLTAPVFEFYGNGFLNLPNWSIDYRLTPGVSDKVVRKLGLGIKFPVIVRGSLDKPLVLPDIKSTAESIIRTPIEGGDLIEDVTKGIGKKLERDLGKQLRDILGGF